MIDRSMNTPGLNTGLKDRNGNDIHLGDTLSFDPAEFGEPKEWVITFEEGELVIFGELDDLSEWVDVVKKWDDSQTKTTHP